MNFDSYFNPPEDPFDPFYEKVIGLIPEQVLSQHDYELYEDWFIDLVTKLYEICSEANPETVSKLVQECWKIYKAKLAEDFDDFDTYEVDDYPEFTENY